MVYKILGLILVIIGAVIVYGAKKFYQLKYKEVANVEEEPHIKAIVNIKLIGFMIAIVGVAIALLLGK